MNELPPEIKHVICQNEMLDKISFYLLWCINYICV